MASQNQNTLTAQFQLFLKLQSNLTVLDLYQKSQKKSYPYFTDFHIDKALKFFQNWFGVYLQLFEQKSSFFPESSWANILGAIKKEHICCIEEHSKVKLYPAMEIANAFSMNDYDKYTANVITLNVNHFQSCSYRPLAHIRKTIYDHCTLLKDQQNGLQYGNNIFYPHITGYDVMMDPAGVNYVRKNQPYIHLVGAGGLSGKIYATLSNESHPQHFLQKAYQKKQIGYASPVCSYQRYTPIKSNTKFSIYDFTINDMVTAKVPVDFEDYTSIETTESLPTNLLVTSFDAQHFIHHLLEDKTFQDLTDDMRHVIHAFGMQFKQGFKTYKWSLEKCCVHLSYLYAQVFQNFLLFVKENNAVHNILQNKEQFLQNLHSESTTNSGADPVNRFTAAYRKISKPSAPQFHLRLCAVSVGEFGLATKAKEQVYDVIVLAIGLAFLQLQDEEKKLLLQHKITLFNESSNYQDAINRYRYPTSNSSAFSDGNDQHSFPKSNSSAFSDGNDQHSFPNSNSHKQTHNVNLLNQIPDYNHYVVTGKAKVKNYFVTFNPFEEDTLCILAFNVDKKTARGMINQIKANKFAQDRKEKFSYFIYLDEKNQWQKQDKPFLESSFNPQQINEQYIVQFASFINKKKEQFTKTLFTKSAQWEAYENNEGSSFYLTYSSLFDAFKKSFDSSSNQSKSTKKDTDSTEGDTNSAQSAEEDEDENKSTNKKQYRYVGRPTHEKQFTAKEKNGSFYIFEPFTYYKENLKQKFNTTEFKCRLTPDLHKKVFFRNSFSLKSKPRLKSKAHEFVWFTKIWAYQLEKLEKLKEKNPRYIKLCNEVIPQENKRLHLERYEKIGLQKYNDPESKYTWPFDVWTGDNQHIATIKDFEIKGRPIVKWCYNRWIVVTLYDKEYQEFIDNFISKSVKDIVLKSKIFPSEQKDQLVSVMQAAMIEYFYMPLTCVMLDNNKQDGYKASDLNMIQADNWIVGAPLIFLEEAQYIDFATQTEDFCFNIRTKRTMFEVQITKENNRFYLWAVNRENEVQTVEPINEFDKSNATHPFFIIETKESSLPTWIDIK